MKVTLSALAEVLAAQRRATKPTKASKKPTTPPAVTTPVRVTEAVTSA